MPVGLICNAWGGTRVEAWISREALILDPRGADEVRGYESCAYAAPASVMPMAVWEHGLRALDTGNAGLAKGWAKPGCDDSAWKTMAIPNGWQTQGVPGSGVLWFRRSVSVPAAWQGRELELRLGAIDKHDDTYVNGERVGGLSWEDGDNTWSTPRIYRVPAHLSTSSTLCLAVRARSHVYQGGIIGPESAMRLHPVGEASGAIALAGPWRYAIEQDWGVQSPPAAPMTPGNPNAPYTLFDSRLAPLIPYGLRGAIWYQGESNTGEPRHYQRLQTLMIRDWRRAFGQGDIAFLQVQLANYMAVQAKPAASSWAELREAQLATLAEPATGMAVAIDVGDTIDIHPTDKRSVGERLARWALAETYARGGVPSGPLFRAMTIEAGSRVRCRFDHAGGLRTRDGATPSHVAIAGIDRVFVWAETAIEGDSLVAWSAQVPKPVAVRYAWADNPLGCNLVNAEGLPASPFRSDTW